MKAIVTVLSLLALCGGATASTRLQYEPVPGLLFSMNIVDAPSAQLGFSEWEALVVARCIAEGGRYTAEARRYDMNKKPIRTVVVYCWEIRT